MARVVLDNVRKVYPNGHEAVRGISLDIGDGEFVVLVGPSGCGKTTTLRMVAGLEDISSGTVSIGGRVVNEEHPKDRDIAMVFQNYALYPHMTVRKNMGFALKLRGVKGEEIDRRVGETARMLGIEGVLDRKPKELSGGQRQRVAVGRAIVREPRAFLFDEPLSNLDAKLRVSTRAELKGLHQRLKTTTIYVTHDQEEAMTLGDRVVVMARGEVQQAGAPLEVYRRPVNRFVAGFVGTPAMNFVEGTVRRDGAGMVFEERALGTGAGMRVMLPREWGGRLGSWEDKGVVLGVRPQAVSVAREGSPAGSTFTLRVKVTEPLGEWVDATCETAGGSRFVARVAAEAGVEAGESVMFATDVSRAHVFEGGEFGRNLTLGL